MKSKRGRKPNDPPTKAYCVHITEEHSKLLRMWGRGDMSAGLRWLIDAAAVMVRKPDQNSEKKT